MTIIPDFMDSSENVCEFIDGIYFDGITPLTQNIVLKTPSKIDFDITHLKFNDSDFKKRLSPLVHIQRMCTFSIISIINYLVSIVPDDMFYVNVGVWHGCSLFAGMIGNDEKKCIGIDNFSEFGGPKKSFFHKFDYWKKDSHYFFEEDYTYFFKNKKNLKIGFYFYDGHHSRENQFNGLRAAEFYLQKGCYILIDDTNDEDVIAGTNDFLDWSKNKYVILTKKSTANNCHPTFWNGIMLLRKIT
jgi:hypothetical protein